MGYVNNKVMSIKNQLVLNPQTQRAVKIGSRTWMNLVKQGIIENDYKDENELSKYSEDDSPEEVEQRIKKINKRLPPYKQAVRGRGKYKNKLVTRNKRLAPTDVSRYTAKMATRVVRENIDELSHCDDIESVLEQLIHSEMVNENRTTKKRPQYQVQEPDEYDDDSSDSSY